MDIGSESLSIGIYEHFKDFPNTRGVGIITDKQFVFYTQYDKCDGFNHESALKYLDKKIYPFKSYQGYYQECKDITIVGDLNEVYMVIPDESISNQQLDFLKYFILEISKYNSEVVEEDKIMMNLTLDYYVNNITFYDYSEVKDILENFKIRDEIREKEEVIIGKQITDLEYNDDIIKK